MRELAGQLAGDDRRHLGRGFAESFEGKISKVAVGFFGLPRSTNYTWPSIQSNIINPASSFNNKIFYHLVRQDSIHNPRSGEFCELSYKNYEFFDNYTGCLESRDEILKQYDLDFFKNFGDAWEDEFFSLQNMICALHSLRVVGELMRSFDPDIYLFVRPDLAYRDCFRSTIIQALHDGPAVARIPCWQWYGGFNDRFAICNRGAAIAYFNRALLLEEFGSIFRQPLHAERLLRYAMDKGGISVIPIGIKADRVRAGGEIVNENYRDDSRKLKNSAFFWALRRTIRGFGRRFHVLCEKA